MSNKNRNKIPICQICSSSTSHLKYKNVNLYPRTCSKICMGKLISLEITKILEDGEKASTKTARKVAKNRKENGTYISGAVKMVDTKNKNNVWEIAARKRLETMIFGETFSKSIKEGMKKIGDDGKTRAQHGSDNAVQTKIKEGTITDPLSLPAFKKYKRDVWKITNKQPLHTLSNIEKRGQVHKEGWHLDHKISIHKGFRDKISADIIGNISNLQMLPALENIRKGTK